MLVLVGASVLAVAWLGPAVVRGEAPTAVPSHSSSAASTHGTASTTASTTASPHSSTRSSTHASAAEGASTHHHTASATGHGKASSHGTHAHAGSTTTATASEEEDATGTPHARTGRTAHSRSSTAKASSASDDEDDDDTASTSGRTATTHGTTHGLRSKATKGAATSDDEDDDGTASTSGRATTAGTASTHGTTHGLRSSWHTASTQGSAMTAGAFSTTPRGPAASSTEASENGSAESADTDEATNGTTSVTTSSSITTATAGTTNSSTQTSSLGQTATATTSSPTTTSASTTSSPTTTSTSTTSSPTTTSASITSSSSSTSEDDSADETSSDDSDSQSPAESTNASFQTTLGTSTTPGEALTASSEASTKTSEPTSTMASSEMPARTTPPSSTTASSEAPTRTSASASTTASSEVPTARTTLPPSTTASSETSSRSSRSSTRTASSSSSWRPSGSATDAMADVFGWRKPGQKRVRATDCGCPGHGQPTKAVFPVNDTFPAALGYAKVFAAYKKAHFDELSLAPGDVLTELQPYSKGWLKGCLRGQRGVFPSNFARVAKACPVPGEPFSFDKPDDDALGPCEPPLIPLWLVFAPAATSTAPTTTPTTRQTAQAAQGRLQMEAVVEFDYSAQEVDELSIHKGDVITDIRTQPGGWWEGCLHGRRGMFPDNFVKIRSKANGTSTKETMANNEVQLRGGSARRCKVLFSYQPANDDELELQINDVIDVLDEVEEGWWRGKLRNRVGVFPSNFVTEITEKQTNGGPGSRKTSATQPPPLSMIRKEEVSGDKMKGVIISETDSPASPTGPDSGNPNALDVDCNAPVLPPKPVKELCRVLYQYEAANEDELTLKEGDIVTIVTKDVQDKGWWKGELRGHTGLFPDNFVVLLPPEESPQARKPERPPPAKTTTSISTRGDISKVPTAKKSLDNSKPDEKAPPVLSKKPVLPPASKKPQLRNAAPAVSPPVNTVTAPKKGGNEVADSPEQRLNDLVDGTASSKLKITNNLSGDADFDGVERGAMLTHPTASRAKAPRRRLPTAMLNKDAEPVGGMLNGNSDHHNHSNENNVSLEETDKENGFDINSSASSGTSSNRNSKEWEKNKAPWMEELKMSQAAKKGIKSPAAPSPPKPETARSKKDIPDSPASPTSPEPPKPNTVTVRQHSTANNIASSAPNHPPSATVSSRPQSVHSEVPATRLSGPGNRPVSMYSTANDKLSTPPSNSVPPDATVPMKQFLELVEKVKKLENHCEFLKRTVTELSLQLNEEKEKRFQMQQEIVKLTDLVTQV